MKMDSRRMGCVCLWKHRCQEHILLYCASPLLRAQVRFFCNAMPWVDCTALRYHCTKLPDVDLCPEAFAQGRFPPGCTARDFIKIDGARPPQVTVRSWSARLAGVVAAHVKL